MALEALEQALYPGVVDTHDALVHYGDRGWQYLSIRYTKRLTEASATAPSSVLSHSREWSTCGMEP